MLVQKKQIVVVWVIITLIGVCFISKIPQDFSDLNHDGIVDVCDIQKLVYLIANPHTTNLADINGDGHVDIKDLQILLNKVGNKENKNKDRIEIIGAFISHPINRIFKMDVERKKDTVCENIKERKEPTITKFVDKHIFRYRYNNEAHKMLGCKSRGSLFFAFHISKGSPPKLLMLLSS